MSLHKFSPKARRKARRACVQAIYQWQLTAHEPQVIATQFGADETLKKIDMAYFRELLFGVINHVQELDDVFMPYLDRPLADLTPIELAVLRIATYELKYRLDIPYKVVINEAVELSKDYGADDAFKYVNSIVDQVAKTLRQAERKG